MESTFGKRVKEFRQSKNLSQTAFAEQCDLTQGNIAHMENGTEPKQSNVTKLVGGFPDLNPDWLLLGTGPMLRDGRVLTPVAPQEPTPSAGLVSGPATDTLTVARGGKQSDPYVEQLLERITEQAKTIDRLWRQNDTLLQGKDDASADAADLYTTIDQIQSEYLARQVESPDYQRFPVGRCIVHRLEVAGFGRELA